VRLGIKVAPPSINASAIDFSVRNGVIFYSLAALKNVGVGAIQHLIATREAGGKYASLGDFARRIHGSVLNKRALESMAKAGAFDEVNANRAQVLAGVETIIATSSRTSAEADAGQNDLFGAATGTKEDLVLPLRDVWLPMERLSHEFEAVGFYLSGHPLDDYMKPLAKLGVDTWASFQHKALTKGASAGKLAGTITHRQERRSKSGNKFAFIGFSDPTGQFEAICFSDTLAAARDLLEPGKAVIARVECDVDGEEIKLRLQGVEVLDKAAAAIVTGLTIFVRDTKPLDSIALRLSPGGKAPVRMILQLESGREVELALGNKFAITPQIKGAIKAIQGVVDVHDF